MEVKKLYRDTLKERFNVEFTDDQYRLAFMKILKKVYGEKSVAANMILEELLIEWDDVVTDFGVGYGMSVYEFDDYLDSHRRPIDHLSSNNDLERYEEHRKLKSIVDVIDDRFKAVTVEVKDFANRDTWWKRRILLKAGSEYFDTLGIDLTLYNIVRT